MYIRTQNIQIMSRNQVIFDILVPAKKDVIQQIIKRKKLTFSIIKLPKFTAQKILYSFL